MHLFVELFALGPADHGSVQEARASPQGLPLRALLSSAQLDKFLSCDIHRHSSSSQTKGSNIFKSWAKIMWNQWTFHDVSLEARRRCSMLLRGAVSLWSSSSWNLALRWGRRVRTASGSTARARGILGRSDGWCMLMFQCITLIIYVTGIIPFLTPSCLYAELILILI